MILTPNVFRKSVGSDLQVLINDIDELISGLVDMVPPATQAVQSKLCDEESVDLGASSNIALLREVTSAYDVDLTKALDRFINCTVGPLSTIIHGDATDKRLR